MAQFNSAKIYAQLSPGKLHKSHAHLESLENCTKCHEQGKKLSSEKCLSCHILLKERIENEKGLHAVEGYQDCSDCHVEHQGREYELIFWPEDKEEFDHAQVGYTLTGAHIKLSCEKCHNETNIMDKPRMLERKKNLNRTFLGLGTTCLSCHHDEHRGQFTGECLTCHTNMRWKPAEQFDHNTASFALTGRHLNVECSKCHAEHRDNQFAEDKSYKIYKDLTFSSCSPPNRVL